jgi:hypothetical protein
MIIWLCRAFFDLRSVGVLSLVGCLVWLPAAVCRCSWGVGLSLLSYWFAGVAPVRGGTYFSLPPQRKVGKRKRACNR